MNEMIYYDLKETSGHPHSLAIQISRELGRRIVAGIYKSKELIEEENSLAKRYKVSRSVIRDAVKILVGKGMLELRRGIGTRVRARSEWMLLDDDVLAWHQSAPVRSEFLKQLIEIRLVIEPKAARWAAERGSLESISVIKEAIEKMEEKKKSLEDFVMADALFHRAVFRAAQNDILTNMEGIIFSALLDSIRLTNKDPRENENSIVFHREVAESIFQKNPGRAEFTMEKLLGDAKDRLLIRLPKDQQERI